jgi:hypothetical protein
VLARDARRDRGRSLAGAGRVARTPRAALCPGSVHRLQPARSIAARASASCSGS